MKWQKAGQLIFFIILVSAAAIIQSALIYAWPPFFNQLNLVLISLVFALFFYGFRSALVVSVIAGFWLDLFSFNFFGFNLLVLGLSAVLVHLALDSWLTNRSLYSFGLLILLATIIYNLTSGTLAYFSVAGSAAFFLGRPLFWQQLLYQSIWSELAAILMFSLVAAATRRLKPFFLEKK